MWKYKQEDPSSCWPGHKHEPLSQKKKKSKKSWSHGSSGRVPALQVQGFSSSSSTTQIKILKSKK
jgi:hypothetical protein